MREEPGFLDRLAKLLYAVASVMVLYGVGFLVINLPAFPLREIRVNGELAHLTREQIQLVISRELKGNFFTLDLHRARVAFEKLPWVRSVSVRRTWPDRLDVTLEEHVTLARWGTLALVNTYGELFQAAAPGEYPVFIGPADSVKEVTEHYHLFNKALQPARLKPAQVMLTPRRAWQVKTESGLVIELGRDHARERLDRFVAVYDRSVGKNPAWVASVDLRYVNGFAARLKPGAPGERKQQ